MDGADGRLCDVKEISMKRMGLGWLMGVMVAGLVGTAPAQGEDMKGLYALTVKDIGGRDVSLSSYQGKVMLIVNVASRCGFTGQYEGLQKLSETYAAQGLVVLGFPANNFMGQEPGTDEEIRAFCSTKYNVTFPMFAKISVKGDDQAPLYRYLTDPATNPEHAAAVSWNFNKFLVGRDGAIVGHFGSRTAPDSEELVAAIEKALAVAPAPAP
jgi:glutathione peroxidase